MQWKERCALNPKPHTQRLSTQNAKAAHLGGALDSGRAGRGGGGGGGGRPLTKEASIAIAQPGQRIHASLSHLPVSIGSSAKPVRAIVDSSAKQVLKLRL